MLLVTEVQVAAAVLGPLVELVHPGKDLRVALGL